jgi:hypothetical protein
LKRDSSVDGEGAIPKPSKIKKAYGIRDVIKQNHRDLIEQEIPYKPTEKGLYISKYQAAVTTVEEKMTEEERVKAQELADLWSKEGAPPDAQLK